MIREGRVSKAVIEEFMKQSGVKEPCPMSSIPDFDVVRDYLLDLMHILYNLIHAIHCVIFGDGWGPNTRNYARKMKVHRSWVIAPPARNARDRRTPAKRLAGKIVGLCEFLRFRTCGRRVHTDGLSWLSYGRRRDYSRYA